MLKTFNAGIGMVVVVDRDRASDHMAGLQDAGEEVVALGSVVAGAGVTYSGTLK